MQQSVVIALVCVALVATAGVSAKPSRSLLAPAPGPASDAVNATAESLFIIEAAMATFTRIIPGGKNGTLTLRNVDPASTFFSEEPLLMSGKISSTELSGPQFFKDGDSDAWLNNANLAMYAPKSNSSSTQSTNIFRLNSAPVISEEGTVWALNVTYIPSTTKSVYAAGAQSFQAAAGSGELVTNYSPVVLFVDALCYVYNRYTGYIYYWYYC